MLTCDDIASALSTRIVTKFSILELLEKLLGFLFGLGHRDFLHKAGGEISLDILNPSCPPTIRALLKYLF